VENKLLVQPENGVSTNSVANNSAAGHVDSLAVTIQEMPVVKKWMLRKNKILPIDSRKDLTYS
jgi:hypothetical protein